MSLSFVAFLAAAGVAALAQGLSQAPAKGGIEGQVVNGVTGEPLRKAQVTLRSADPRRSMTYGAVTDASGAFAVRDVEKGSYRLSVERTGFVRADYGGRSSGGGRGSSTGSASIAVDAGQNITGLLMKLTPQAVITGRILDEDGDPVPGVQVNVLKYGYVRGKRQLTPSGGSSTDDQGEYRIHSLQPGKYYVSATYRPMGMSFGRSGPGNRPGEEGYAPTYYPRTVDVAAAAALDAAPGAVLRNIDIMLTKVKTVQVGGKVVDPAGGGGRNIMVMAFPRDTPGGMFTGGRPSSGVEDGKFVIRGLRPGSYILTAERWDRQRRSTARLPVEVGASPIEGLTLTMQPSLEVSGRLRVDGPGEVKLSGMSVYLQPRTEMAMMGSAGGRVKEDGRFTLSNAGPDLYTITVMGMPENCYMKSVSFGEEDALANGLNLARGAGAPVEIVLSPTAGSVEVVVLDAKQQPAAGATVVAVPEGVRAESQQFYKNGVTDPYGRVILKGLAPGDYKLYAWEEIEPNAWQDPEFRKPYERNAESLSIKENGRESRQMTVIAAGEGK